MDLLEYNLSWMLFNVALALVPVLITVILNQKFSKATNIFLLLIWFLYLPNTIYLLTDIQYFPEQFIESVFFTKIALIMQYSFLMILGIVAYMISLRPFEKFVLKNKNLKSQKDFWYVGLNFIIAFAVVLGKVHRVHSWYVVTDPLRVINAVISTISSIELLLLVFFFGILTNLIFICARRFILRLKR